MVFPDLDRGRVGLLVPPAPSTWHADPHRARARHELPGDGRRGRLPNHHLITWPYAPSHLGIASTEEVLATFSSEVADRHPPTGPTTDATGVEHSGKEGVRLST
jgi:hypothetical protein